MNNLYIGIDPGKTGFITVLNSDTEELIFHPMPKIGEEIDSQGLDKIFKSMKGSGRIVHACTELVHAIYGASAKSTFEFGYVNGLIEMVLVSNDIPFTKIQPKKWQAQMWVGVPLQRKLVSTEKTMVNDTKSMSEMAAKRLLPNVDFRRTERSRKCDDNKVDATLICLFCYKNFKL